MRLSCNFVNVYTIAYRMYSARLHVYTCASLTNIVARILARKSARVGQVGEDRRACPARGQAEWGSGRTRRHPRDDPRAEVGEDVGVGPVEL